MPAVSDAARVPAAQIQPSDSFPLDRAGDTTPRRATAADIRDYAGLTAAQKAKLDGIEPLATADQTGAQIVALLTALQGGDRLSAAALQGLPAAAANGDLTGVALDGSTLTFTRRAGANIVLNLPAGSDDGGGAALTGTQIVALLEALGGADRLSASALDGFAAAVEAATDGDLTGVALAGRILTFSRRGQANTVINLPAAGGGAQAQTGPEIVALLAALQGAARLSYNDLKDLPADTADPADTWAQQFSIIGQADGVSARDLAAGTSAAGEIIVPFKAAIVADEAGLGMTRATGRTAFTNLHTDADTALRATGALKVFLRNTPAGQLRAEWREYNATNVLLATTVLATHGVAASAARTTFDLPLGSTPVTARKGRTYDLYLVFAPAAAVGAGGGSFGVDAGADDANILALLRWTRDPAADLTALDARVNALENAPDPQPGGGGGSLGLPAKVAQPLRDRNLYIRVTSDDQGAPTHSYDDTAHIPGVIASVTDLATPPRALNQRLRLTAHWRANPPGDYIGAANPVDRNVVNGTLASRDITYEGQARKQYGWDTVQPGVFGSVEHAQEFAPEFYWWQPQGPGSPWVLNVWIPNAYADARASLYIEVTSSETGTTIGQGLNRTSGRLGQTHRQYQSHAPLSADEVAALAAIHDTAGDNDIALNFFESPDGSAKGAALNFQPEFIWEALLGQPHLAPILNQNQRANRLLRGDHLLADWGVEPVYAAQEDARVDGVLTRPGTVYTLLRNNGTRPQRFFVRRGLPGTDGVDGAVNGRNRLLLRLNPFTNGLGYYWAEPYRAGHFLLFDNVIEVDHIDRGHSIGVVTLAGAAAGEQPLVQIGVRNAADPESFGSFVQWPADNFWVQIGNRIDHAGRPASDFTLQLTRNAAGETTADYGGHTYNLYSYRFNEQLAADLGPHGQWLFDDDTVRLDFSVANGGAGINFSPAEHQFTRGAGFTAATDAVPVAAVPLPGDRQLTRIPIAIPAFHPSHSQAAVADHIAFTHRVTAVQAGTDVDVGAKFTINTTGANPANRLECDFRLELARGPTILDRASHYVRHSAPTEFTIASFSLGGVVDELRAGDTIRLVSRSFDQFADSDLMIQTAAQHAVNQLTLARRT